MNLKALITLGLLITAMWSFFGAHTETEAPILRVGDKWTYEYTDFDSNVVDQCTENVSKLEDFGGVPCYVMIEDYPADARVHTVWLTSDWTVLKIDNLWKDDQTRGIDVFNPGLKYYDFPLSVGKEWSWESTGEITFLNITTGEKIFTDSRFMARVRKVVSKYAITVPAGTFDTYLIEENQNGNLTRRYWFSVDAKNIVKFETYLDGQCDYRQVLTSYKLVGQGNGFSISYLIIAVATIIGVLGLTIYIYYRRHQGTSDAQQKQR